MASIAGPALMLGVPPVDRVQRNTTSLFQLGIARGMTEIVEKRPLSASCTGESAPPPRSAHDRRHPVGTRRCAHDSRELGPCSAGSSASGPRQARLSGRPRIRPRCATSWAAASWRGPASAPTGTEVGPAGRRLGSPWPSSRGSPPPPTPTG